MTETRGFCRNKAQEDDLLAYGLKPRAIFMAERGAETVQACIASFRGRPGTLVISHDLRVLGGTKRLVAEIMAQLEKLNIKVADLTHTKILSPCEDGNGALVVSDTFEEFAPLLAAARDNRDIVADLLYLASEAFAFHLDVNPHATCFDTVEDETEDRPGTARGDWLSEEQHRAALDTGRFVSGQVYPNGSVSFYLVYGTDIAAVVAECAKVCREDRVRWTKAHGPTQPKPVGRNSDRKPLT